MLADSTNLGGGGDGCASTDAEDDEGELDKEAQLRAERRRRKRRRWVRAWRRYESSLPSRLKPQSRLWCAPEKRHDAFCSVFQSLSIADVQFAFVSAFLACRALLQGLCRRMSRSACLPARRTPTASGSTRSAAPRNSGR